MADMTISAYDQHAESWAAQRTGPSFWAHARERLRTVLPPGSRLIEFGTGPGWDGAELARDYVYTGLDASAGMLALARERLPAAPLWHMDLRTMKLPADTEPFDGFWSAAVLLHIPRAEIIPVLSNMAAMLRPGAPGFISIKAGEGEEERSSPEIPSPRLFTYWDRDSFTAALASSGYEVLQHAEKATASALWHEFLVRRA